ncbi:UdgX family uracil-DNA binding protein [Phaeacidiphilus oryzae]|uniref:UdgX family uracil-DNA binding protein n=1 Tax=Phaeacidiphilus oryzae TaxID=348818 RepID=UPI0005671C09|nr:UdgX family uracil-DNA binding protein [Phaeacidiphilus oryzae]
MPGEEYDAGPFLPAGGGRSLTALRRAAADCRGCPLHADATQTVFGRGSAGARVMLIGEQPGDQEDRRGEPFVGPAGGVLRKALDEAGLDPDQAYVTNAVKHFKFKLGGSGGKRRLHQPPTLREAAACRPWLEAELRLVAPELLVALGATAGRALLGSGFRVTRDRGRLLEAEGRPLIATIHPSAVLRADRDAREAAREGLVADLELAARTLAGDA